MSEDSKRHNSKNVRVNAQVTAIITVLEFIGGCLFVIGWVFRLQVTLGSFVGVIITMILYFNILSYAFLMNTRYNKGRIIEEGWMNVFKNMVVSYKSNVIAQDDNPIVCSNRGEKLNIAEAKRDIPRIFLVPDRSETSKSEKIALSTLNSTSFDTNKEADLEMQQPTCSYTAAYLENNSTDCIKKDNGVKDKTSIVSIRKHMI